MKGDCAPFPPAVIPPRMGTWCGRAADAGPGSASGVGQGTSVLLAPGPSQAAGWDRGSGLHGDSRSLFRPTLPKGLPTHRPPDAGLPGMRERAAACRVLPNLHGSQSPLWKGLYKIVTLSHLYFPSTLLARA